VQQDRVRHATKVGGGLLDGSHKPREFQAVPVRKETNLGGDLESVQQLAGRSGKGAVPVKVLVVVRGVERGYAEIESCFE
jgi:hypothetical protein